SVAIMKLKQEGKLDYDQKVISILNDFPHNNITIKHLLQHTSGIADYIELINENFVSKNSTKRNILGNNEILDIFYKSNPKLSFQPGEQWEYSNTGYMVLSSIVEKISNQHFRDYLKENIFDPLGMNNTTLYSYQEGNDLNMPDRVFGYKKSEDNESYELNDYHVVNDVRGDGGIYSTLNDLYIWNMALVNYKILPKKYLDEAWTLGELGNGENTGYSERPEYSRYGYGWFLGDDTKPKNIFHSGGWVGFATYLFNEIETNSGFIILTNNSSRLIQETIEEINRIRTEFSDLTNAN
nr:beta-lactamase family protein [Flavobacteriales bacterium]